MMMIWMIHHTMNDSRTSHLSSHHPTMIIMIMVKTKNVSSFAFRVFALAFSFLVLSLDNVHGWGSSNSNLDNRRVALKRLLTGGTTATAVTATVIAAAATTTAAVSPSVAHAGEVGARITKAVTTSDLGISVRTSVVKGAQEMDKLDKSWELFSDKLGLGAERTRNKKPPPKVIPNRRPLQVDIAAKIVDIMDIVFCSVTKVSTKDLRQQIELVAEKVKPSFARSGLSNEEMDFTSPLTQSGKQFNFLCYIHYKAYSDIIIDRNIEFRSNRKAFETEMGNQLVSLLLPDWKTALSESLSSSTPPTTGEARIEQLNTALRALEDLGKQLVQLGLVAQTDTSSLEKDRIQDWADDLADIQWTVALDGDVTQASQILLQEQGFRLYPSFARYAVQSILRTIMRGQSVEVTDYYMDTDYNADPDLFEVKEILLNIVLESSD